MKPSARRRPGTSPSFWRNYHNAQSIIAARSTQTVPSGIARRPNVQNVIAEYETNKKPAPAHFVSVGPKGENIRRVRDSLLAGSAAGFGAIQATTQQFCTRGQDGQEHTGSDRARSFAR